MRKLLILSSFVLLFLFYELAISQYHFSIIPEELEPENAPGYYDYKGITHAHTNIGLGSAPPSEVVEAAQEVGLDFLILTDLNNFNPNREIAGYHRQTLVFVAQQFSYLDSRLIIYDSLNPRTIGTLGEAQMTLADLLSQSGKDSQQDLIVLAHPFKSGYSWSGAYPSGLDGIEVINLKSVWRKAWESYKPSFFWSVLIYPFNSQLAFVRLYTEPRDEIQLWNKLNQTQKALGFSGAEATARTGSISGELYFKFPSYQTSFALSTNHVLLRSELTGDKTKDSQKIMEALSGGQFYMALDLLGNPKGFSYSLIDGERILPMGSEVQFKKGMKLSVHLPRKPKVPFEIQVFKDGDHMMSSSSVESEYEVHGPGVYRVVVRAIPTLPLPDGKRWISWIYSNPIYVR